MCRLVTASPLQVDKMTEAEAKRKLKAFLRGVQAYEQERRSSRVKREA